MTATSMMGEVSTMSTADPTTSMRRLRKAKPRLSSTTRCTLMSGTPPSMLIEGLLERNW